MKKAKTDPLFPVLLLGLAADAFLENRIDLWSRVGLLALLPAALTIGTIGWLAQRAAAGLPPSAAALAGAPLLVFSAAVEILRLNALYAALYPSTLNLLTVGAALLLPGVFLRRNAALVRTAQVLLALLPVCLGVLLLSVAARLRVSNLQSVPVTRASLTYAWKARLWLRPEYLLPGFLPALSARRSVSRQGMPFRLALSAGLLAAAFHLLLELFFGAGLPGVENPLHSAARCGALSVFNRLEWLQLALWTMAVTVRLALYLYAASRLCGTAIRAQSPADSLLPFGLCAGAVLFLAGTLRIMPLSGLQRLQNRLIWGCALAEILTGEGRTWIQRLKRTLGKS